MGRNTLKKILQEKALAISQTAELMVQKTSDWQVIRKSITNRCDKIILTASQKEKKKRYEYAFSLLMSRKYSQEQLVDSICTLFNIETVQAYEDLKYTKEIFGEAITIDKRFEMMLQLEAMKSFKRKCEQVGNADAVVKIDKNIIALLREIKDLDVVPGEMFEGHTIVADFNPSKIGAPDITKEAFTELMKRIAEKRGKTFEAVDIPYEDIK